MEKETEREIKVCWDCPYYDGDYCGFYGRNSEMPPSLGLKRRAGFCDVSKIIVVEEVEDVV